MLSCLFCLLMTKIYNVLLLLEKLRFLLHSLTFINFKVVSSCHCIKLTFGAADRFFVFILKEFL